MSEQKPKGTRVGLIKWIKDNRYQISYTEWKTLDRATRLADYDKYQRGQKL